MGDRPTLTAWDSLRHRGFRVVESVAAQRVWRCGDAERWGFDASDVCVVWSAVHGAGVVAAGELHAVSSGAGSCWCTGGWSGGGSVAGGG